MAETPNREVNADTEVLNLEEEPATEVEDEDLDEEVIPPVDEEEPATEVEEPEAPAESSPDGTEPETPEPAPSQQPAPVPGETPREKALRLEVQRLKGLRRKESIQEIAGPETAPVQTKSVTDRMAKLKETYSDAEIHAMEEAIDVLAESKGYVKQSQSYQQTVNTTVEDFIEANPEYKPENDPEDVRWTRFQDILKSGIYNVSGKTPKQLRQIFDKVSEDVVKELGSSTVAIQANKDAAQRQKIKSVSHSGGTRTPAVKPVESIAPTVRSMFKGFDDDDLR